MGRLLLLSIFLSCLSAQVQAQDTGCPIITSTAQDFCDYVYDEAARKVIPASISQLQVEGDPEKTIVWYSEEMEPLAMDYQLEDGAEYFAAYTDGSCETLPSVTVRVDRQPIAGRTSTVWICANSEPVEIYDLMPVLNDGTNRPAEPGGTVNPTLKSGGTLFDPSLEVSGKSYKYITPNSQYGICGPDDATIWIHILPAPNAGADIRKEVEVIEEPFKLITLLGEGIATDGKWFPELTDGTFDPESGTSGIFTYTVKSSGGGITCEDSAQIEIVMLPTVTVCHNGKPMTIKINALSGHLKHNDIPGGCGTAEVSETIISPNPSHGVFNFHNNETEISQIRITDFNGNLQKQFHASYGTGLREIDISSLRKGIYFAEIITPQGKQVERLIKK